MGLPAYIYARFSTQEQSEGDSLNRQLEGARAFIKERKWDYALEREMIDEGKSAFHGSNRIEGAQLYQFEKKALAGHFDNGAVLVVENTDRLTRAGYETAFEIIRGFTSKGVTVATWSPQHVYEAHARIDMGQAMRLIVEAELAHEESTKKSKRLRASWQTRIAGVENGSGSAVTGIVPGWLDVETTRVDGKPFRTITPNAHRVAILNDIFDWYCEGKGLPWIVSTLNARNEPTWGRGKQAEGKGWNVSTVHKYLTSRTVLGEYAPKIRTGKDVKVSRGVVMPDYYPQVIAPDKFNRVHALRADRTGWGGKNQFHFPNLFTNIAKCFHCGGTLKQNGIQKAGTVREHANKNGTSRKSTQKTTRSYLKCSNALRGFNCDNRRGYRYEPLETGIIDVLIHWMEKQQDFAPDSKVGQLVTSVAEQERQAQLKRQQLDQLVTNMMEVFSKALAQKASELEQQIEADEDQIQRTRRELEQARGTASPEESLINLQEAKANLQHEDDETRYAARVRANQSLRRLLTRMDGDNQGSIHLNVGNGLYLCFNAQGVCEETAIIQGAVETGPNGEIDWHPDFPDADYSIHPAAL